jgi:hypothetical protein
MITNGKKKTDSSRKLLLMPTCPVCKKDFHACPSCSFIENWKHRYCSEKCWEESEEYKLNKKQIDALIDSMNQNQLHLFECFLEMDEDWLFYSSEKLRKQKTC